MPDLKTLLDLIHQEPDPLVQAEMLHQNRDVLRYNGYTSDQHRDIGFMYQTVAQRLQDPQLKAVFEKKSQEYRKKAGL
ncbi:hypothetical protein HY492_02315 [Candidatus Woesearchaeota archaeon]|nr:hypothetical protein [Candidatus Woesearchaeota archaeon]